MTLFDCDWIRLSNSFFITGTTGAGKTYLMSAFDWETCNREFYSPDIPRTFQLTGMRKKYDDGSYNQINFSLLKPNLLILDVYSLKRFEVAMGQDFKEVIEERGGLTGRPGSLLSFR